jgi:PAS domain S-box-containing protein
LSNPSIPTPLRFRVKHKDGHYILIDGMVTNMLHNEAIKGIVANFRDITEIQRAEQKLRESEKIYKIIASSIPGSVICLFDRDYRYFLVEGDMLESLGYSKEKLLGNKVEDVTTPERYAEVLPQFKRVFEGETFMVENARPGIDTVSRFVPLRDENNNVFAAMVVVFDVSELKNAQRTLAQLNATLEHKIAERTRELEIVNKELESFSYSVAHDLRTPLRAVYGYAVILEEEFATQLDDEGKRLIYAVGRNAKKMEKLIDDLLSFSKLGRKEVQKSLVDMKEITESCLNDIYPDGRYNGEIKVNSLHTVMADSSLMKHVMINLLSNAIKYSSKKEMPVIEISSRKENDEIIYSVADNGVGFDMELADKLFGVFQRLHSDKEFEGTGVGLAIVQRIIQRHNGTIWAESKVDLGSTFHFSLPAISEE